MSIKYQKGFVGISDVGRVQYDMFNKKQQSNHRKLKMYNYQFEEGNCVEKNFPHVLEDELDKLRRKCYNNYKNEI